MTLMRGEGAAPPFRSELTGRQRHPSPCMSRHRRSWLSDFGRQQGPATRVRGSVGCRAASGWAVCAHGAHA